MRTRQICNLFKTSTFLPALKQSPGKSHCAARAVRKACVAGLGAVLLASCTSAPKPPSVDESTRRPVNAAATVDLKACQGDLSRAALLVSVMAQGSVLTSSTIQAQTAKAPPQAPQANHAQAEPMPSTNDQKADHASANLVAVVMFGMGSAAWNVGVADAAALARRAQQATVIMIRGRTDATGESVKETALARRRAEAAAAFLQRAGVPRDKLRLTWQGAGDQAPGLLPAERGQSRRVEIEFYAAAPTIVILRSGAAAFRSTTAASF